MKLKYKITVDALHDLLTETQFTVLEKPVAVWIETWLKGSRTRKVPPMALDELRAYPALLGWFQRWNLPIPVTSDDLRKGTKKTCPYRGVYWETSRQCWAASIPLGHGKTRVVYRGPDPEAAARAYDKGVAGRKYASGRPYPTNQSLGLLK